MTSPPEEGPGASAPGVGSEPVPSSPATSGDRYRHAADPVAEPAGTDAAGPGAVDSGTIVADLVDPAVQPVSGTLLERTVEFESPEDEPTEPRGDWAWIEEWRAGSEPTPWGPGLIISAFVAVLVSVAVYVITAGLADRPWFAVIANIVVVAGLSPALWLSRGLPVLRWVALGGAVGVAAAWFAVLLFPIG